MTEILDSNGTQITIGARVLDPDPTAFSNGGVVTEITEPDGDVNEYGRAVPVGPYVVVTYDDGSTERWIARWNATGPWDDHRTDYTCDDVTVVPTSRLDWFERVRPVDMAAVEALERYGAQREPDGQRVEAGRIVPTDR